MSASLPELRKKAEEAIDAQALQRVLMRLKAARSSDVLAYPTRAEARVLQHSVGVMFASGLSIAEISRLVEMPDRTVRSWIAKSQRDLGNQLDGEQMREYLRIRLEAIADRVESSAMTPQDLDVARRALMDIAKITGVLAPAAQQPPTQQQNNVFLSGEAVERLMAGVDERWRQYQEQRARRVGTLPSASQSEEAADGGSD